MIRSQARLLLIALGVVLFPQLSPAPLIYRPGEGWVYERVGGGGSWQRDRAKDQLDVATEAFNNQDYSLAMKAAKRVVSVWPLSDFAPQGLYLTGRCYEAQKYDEKAFNIYRDLLLKYPKAINYEEVLRRQFEIANRFLAGQWFKLWGVIPFFPSMEKTAAMYRELIARGPYSPVAPLAQLSLGATYEKMDRPDMLPLATAAFMTAADRYHDQQGLAAEALFRAGLTLQMQAKKAEYDQSIASQGIATFTDFIGLYPNDARVTEAQKIITDLKQEQARGAMSIAQFYDKRLRRDGALVYYNEVILKSPNSPLAETARERIVSIKATVAAIPLTPPTAPVPDSAPQTNAPTVPGSAPK